MTVAIAIVGGGKIARDQHVPAIAGSDDFTLAAAVTLADAELPGIPNFRTVAEMKAWRRAQHGEDLSAPAEDFDDAGSLAGVELLPVESGFVREPGTSERAGNGESRRREGRESEAVLAGAARESSGDDYAPFGATARGAAPCSRSSGRTLKGERP